MMIQRTYRTHFTDVRLRGLLVVVLVALSSSLMAQDCMDELRRIYAKTNRPEARLEKGATYYLKMRMVTTPVDSQDVPPTDVVVEMTMQKGKLRVESSLMRVFKDEHLSALVLPDRKVIYLMNTAAPKSPEDRMEAMELVQDTLFTFCKVASCQDIKSPSGHCGKRMVLEVNLAGQRRFGIQRLTFVTDQDQDRLTELTVWYGPGRPYHRQQVYYQALDFNHSAQGMDVPVKKLIFSGGVLHPDFSGYQLIDTRN